MVEALCNVMQKKTKEIVGVPCFISVTSDEVTTVNNQSWLCSHVYIIHNWKQVPILLGLVQVVDGYGADNLTVVILEALMETGGLSKEALDEKLICFGADGHPSFQGCMNGVATQLKKGYSPYLFSMHCVAHRTSLATGALSALPIMATLKDLV